jgi:hypothetical protein
MGRKSRLTVHAGENDRTQYRTYDRLDSIGMKRLTNLIIHISAAR